MSRDPRLYLEDIRESCEKIFRYAKDMDFDRFIADEKTIDAVIRNLTIIGEAAKNVPDEIRKRYPEVNWRAIAGLWNVVVHEYFGVDDKILWDVVRNKIPELLSHVDHILKTEFPENGPGQ